MPKERARRWLDNVRHFLRLDRLPSLARKIVVMIVGGFILATGVVMLVTPGPAFVLIPAGLLILGSEFTWAQTALHKTTQVLGRLRRKWRRRKTGTRAA